MNRYIYPSSVNKMCHLFVGKWRQWTGPQLSHRRTVLLLFSPGKSRPHPGGSHPRRDLHRFHAGILRILLQDVDWRVGIQRQGCKNFWLFFFKRNRDGRHQKLAFSIPYVFFRSGCQTAEGTANGHARTPRKVHDPRAEPVHPHGGCVRRSLHRSPVSAGWFYG